jgi:DeoR/GlpR family transcriptional regulator of sugar metabolism
MMRSDVVNAVLEKGAEAIVLTDSSKFSHSPYTLGPLERFSRVSPTPDLAPAYKCSLSTPD